MPAETARRGVTVPLDGVPLHAHRDVFEAVAALGYTDLWSSETAGADAFTPLALAAAWAPSLRLGTAIVPVHTRGPALLAMSAAALADAAPGRFALGIGASSPAVVTAWNGIAHADPYVRTRDVLRFLRRALAGERIDETAPTFTVRGFRLDRVPDVPPALLVAALRPGMLRLGGREADGVILNWLAADDVPTAVAEFAAGREAADGGDAPAGREGAGGGAGEVVARVFVCPTEDAAFARTLGRRLISSYLTVPAYAAFHRWLGRGAALGPMWDAWAAGDRRAANAAVPDDVVDALVIHGTPAACRAHVERYVAAGVTTPVVALLPTGPAPTAGDLEASLRALAP